MRTLDRWIFGTVVLLCGTMIASAQPNQYCEAFFDQMAADTLYVANCGTRAGCLEEVVDDGDNAVLRAANGSTHRLHRGQLYNFLYKTLQGGLPNSLVVVQVKQLDTTRKTTTEPSPVRLRRYGFDFACFRGQRNVSLPQWPIEGVRGRDLTAVPYNKYDQFHREGSTSPEEDLVLRTKFHVRYFNGETCVSTLNPVRRAQFLLHDPKHFAGRFEAFLGSIGFYSTQANAEELDTVKKYERLKILVSNYSRGNNAEGCVAFSSKAGRPESSRLDIVLRDIEKQVQAYPDDLSRSWSFVLQ